MTTVLKKAEEFYYTKLQNCSQLVLQQRIPCLSVGLS